MATKTDGGAAEWAIDGDVIRLRHWASEVVELLPTELTNVTIGTEEGCTIRLVDKSGRASRRHAQISHEKGHWILRDLNSKNGLQIDGARCGQVVLQPGLEIGLGGVTLVAESRGFCDLRGFVSRLLGWGVDQIEAVDLALRAVRHAAARRAPLVLSGDGDLVALAHDLHRHTLGDERPFVVCDPRRSTGEATVRSAANRESGLAALEAARGGSVCLWAKHLPPDSQAMNAALRAPDARVQLMVCAHERGDGKAFLSPPVVVPALSKRVSDLPRIVDEYAREARTFLSADAPFARVDHDWVINHSAATLPEIEKGTLRVVAIRKAGSVAGAAELLGMSHTSLLRWLDRRRLPAIAEHPR